MSMLHCTSGGATEDKLYVDDVFSTYLYTGNGSTQTINNGIDLAGKGGMVWLKYRNVAADHILSNTIRPLYNRASTNLTSAEANTGSGFINGFTSSGFTVGNGNDVNANASTYASWTFRKAPKFFDVVAGTGTGTFNHSLGVTPVCIVFKRASVADNWYVAHNGLTGGINGNRQCYLNTTSAEINTFSNFSATSTTFSPNPFIGASDPWVAYLFAHDTSADGIIQCGSFTTDASGNATVNTIGWEPQWGMFKASSGTGDWIMLDQMRGWNMTVNDAKLAANASAAEVTTTEYGNPTATGFEFKGGSASTTYIYLAIRRPNKPPTSGTEVFSADQAAALPNMVKPQRSTDMVLTRFQRDTDTSKVWLLADRLRSMFCAPTSTTVPTLETNSTAAETTYGSGNRLLAAAPYSVQLGGSGPQISYLFSRAPGFFDVVCYTGNGTVLNVPHSLGVPPELLIVKNRTQSGYSFETYAAALGAGGGVRLNTSTGYSSNTSLWNITSPTATVFTVGVSTGYPGTNGSSIPHVAYLFASLPGVSKVGSYTGNGSSQTINCGFSTGARFVLSKAVSTTGNWNIGDSARGITSGTDPLLCLNTTAAEVTTDDWLDPESSGFIVNETASAHANTNGVQYIFLAIA